MGGTDSVRRAIVDAIGDHGPISFAELMELALYGPGGFYDRSPVGPSGDFVTSPHVHPVFGELLGRAVRSLWQDLGEPVPLRIAEVGAGDGTLARQLLAELRDVHVNYAAIERDATARAALAEVAGISIEREIPMDAQVVLANELLDNLPFRVLRDGDEVRIGARADRLIEVMVPPDAELRSLLRAGGVAGEVVIPIGAIAFIEEVAKALRPAGYCVVIDYGDTGPSGGVHGYRAHRIVPDVLAAPGFTDITAGVDLDMVARSARAAGLQTFPLISQHDALMALGLGAWLREELSRQGDQLNAGEGGAAVRTWSGRSRATILADPAGLGRFRWLVLATQGLPAPAWLTPAQ